jgi:hypothetical protein
MCKLLTSWKSECSNQQAGTSTKCFSHPVRLQTNNWCIPANSPEVPRLPLHCIFRSWGRRRPCESCNHDLKGVGWRTLVLRLPQTGAKYSQRWRRRQFRPSFAWTAAKRFAWLSTPTRQFRGSVCDNVLLIRRRRGTFIACLRRWRNFQVCISIRPL